MTKNRTFADEFCPYCFRRLLLCRNGEHMVCPAEIECNYEFFDATLHKMPADEITALKGRRKRLLKDIEKIEKQYFRAYRSL